MNKNDVIELIDRVGARLGYGTHTKNSQDKGMYAWEWHHGVGLYGMIRYYFQTGDENILKGIINWFEKNFEKGNPKLRHVNSTAPVFTLAYLYEITGDKRYGEFCDDWAKWVMNELPRTEEGAFQHTVSNGQNYNQVWDDTLFMAVLFLAKYGVMTKNEEYINETIRQFLVHLKYLTDVETGLLFHGWTFEGRHNFARARWARGNSWLTTVIVDYFDIVENLNGGVKMFLIEALKSQVKALKKYQDESGMWHTLIDVPESYLETSATAGFAYGILKGVRLGYLDKEYEEAAIKAVKAVISNIDKDGYILKVSYGTGMGNTLQEYMDVPYEMQPSFGSALTILMLTECLHEGHLEFLK